jgi:malate/lactate dehydrogenase
MKPFREETVILLVANPVDVLTYYAQKFAGLPRSQVIGSGTFLDSARLRGILADKIGVDAGSVDAYVLGEHGETQLVRRVYQSNADNKLNRTTGCLVMRHCWGSPHGSMLTTRHHNRPQGSCS